MFNRLQALIEKHSKTLLLLSLIYVFAITILRGIRWPNDWSEAHWLISYRFGFVKRGLMGSLLEIFFRNDPQQGILYFSFTFLLLFFIAIFLISLSIIRRSGWGTHEILLAFIFLASPFIVMSAHLVGYFDNITLLICILSLLLIERRQYLIASLLLSIGILIHENSVAFSFPLALLAVYIQWLFRGQGARQALLLKNLVAIFAVPVITFLSLLINQENNPGQVRQALQGHLARHPFIENGYDTMVASSYTTSFQYYLAEQSRNFHHKILVPKYYVCYALPLLSMWLLAWVGFRKSIPAWKNIILSFILISLLPLLLHFIAWDTSRIWSYILVMAFLSYWIIQKYVDRSQAGHSFMIPAIVYTFFLFELVFQTPLMDGATDRFPYTYRIALYLPAILIFLLVLSSRFNKNQNTPPAP